LYDASAGAEDQAWIAINVNLAGEADRKPVIPSDAGERIIVATVPNRDDASRCFRIARPHSVATRIRIHGDEGRGVDREPLVVLGKPEPHRACHLLAHSLLHTPGIPEVEDEGNSRALCDEPPRLVRHMRRTRRRHRNVAPGGRDPSR
jgi:hypothetical protein